MVIATHPIFSAAKHSDQQERLQTATLKEGLSRASLVNDGIKGSSHHDHDHHDHHTHLARACKQGFGPFREV